ncbi:MAG: hypothetical protein J0I10_01575 [Verrucomicrobia bacterium]|nr:hypothetical protein [Verrucomicrobiota bacterium]
MAESREFDADAEVAAFAEEFRRKIVALNQHLEAVFSLSGDISKIKSHLVETGKPTYRMAVLSQKRGCRFDLRIQIVFIVGTKVDGKPGIFVDKISAPAPCSFSDLKNTIGIQTCIVQRSSIKCLSGSVKYDRWHG